MKNFRTSSKRHLLAVESSIAARTDNERYALLNSTQWQNKRIDSNATVLMRLLRLGR